MSKHPSLIPALEHFIAHADTYLGYLKELVRIPSISFPGFDPAPVSRCADAVAELFRKISLDDVRILKPSVGHPSVFAQWTGAPGKPTILLYAHHDVQPTGRDELWASPPFEPAERKGRLYGRGISDDKAGVVMHAAAIASYLGAAKTLPINVKVLIEGEEEVGSESLWEYVQKNKAKLKADALVVSDPHAVAWTFNIRGAKTHLSRLVERVGHADGEENSPVGLHGRTDRGTRRVAGPRARLAR